MASTIDPAQCTLLVIDLQTRLLPAIEGSDGILKNAAILLQCANMLEIKTVATEQLPERLGATTSQVTEHHRGPTLHKSAFGAAKDSALLSSLEPRREVVILGTETHVCVLQTALQLLDAGYTVWVACDASGSRSDSNKQAGLARMQNAGAVLVSTEMVIFEWLADAEHPNFRDALALIK